MAGDWIKMRGNLWDDPRVARLCDLTDSGEAAVVGALYWLWATADQHTENGILPGLTLRAIDRKTGVSGFGQALCDIGWLADHPEGVRIVNFEEHNGASAKRRASDAQRKATVRSVSASDADKLRNDGGQDAELLRRIAELEKELEKEKRVIPSVAIATGATAPADPGGAGDPDDPTDPADPIDPAEVIFGLGVPLLTASGVTDRNARSMLGLMRKTRGDAAVIDAIHRCSIAKPLEPVAWLQAAMKPAKAGKHAGFDAKDYSSGVTADGFIA